ncbi:MAG TPA: 3',5'-nucleoside bisphosphate phosphatase [Eoetvoesiella sp.]
MTAASSLNVDLHCHSAVSDGVLTPADIAARAHANGVQVWALTDHDELLGLSLAGATARALGMRFIPGVEISVTWANQTVHILGLNIDPDNAALRAGLAVVRAGRIKRAKEIATRLDALGMTGSLEGVLPYVSNPELISRTHFARFMVKQGYCKTMQAVFDKYLGDGKPASVRVQWASLEEAVAWVTNAGGRAAIAHPGRYAYSSTQYGALFDQFKQMGGEGIEVITGSHTVAQYSQYAQIARNYGFLASRGSDFHSPGESRIDLGCLPALPSDLKPIWHDWV